MPAWLGRDSVKAGNEWRPPRVTYLVSLGLLMLAATFAAIGVPLHLAWLAGPFAVSVAVAGGSATWIFIRRVTRNYPDL
jgi:hypothetical protein